MTIENEAYLDVTKAGKMSSDLLGLTTRIAMLGSALYHPHIDIPNPIWLRSAVLFWDEIRTITPDSIRTPYRTNDTKILWQEGYLEPLRCDQFPELLDALGKRVVRLMDGGRLSDNLGLTKHANDPNSKALHYARQSGRAIHKKFDLAGLYPSKMSVELRDAIMRAGLARKKPTSGEMENIQALGRQSSAPCMPDEHDFLLVDSQFAGAYMSALAALLAKETDLSTLTSEEPSMGVNLQTLLQDFDPTYIHSDKKGALVSVVMEAIRVDPSTRIDKLLSFRRGRQNQFAELSAQFDDISGKITTCESAEELKKQVQEAYAKKIRPKLESLKGELRDNSIQAVWDGMQRAVTVSIPAGGAMAYFTGMKGPVLIAAGAAIAVADVAVKAYLGQRKARRASPFSYLLDLEHKFSAPSI